VSRVEAEVLAGLDQQGVGRNSRAIREVGEVPAEQAERTDRGAVGNDDLECVRWQELGLGSSGSRNTRLGRVPHGCGDIGGKGAEGGEVEIAVARLACNNELERSTDATPRHRGSAEPLTAQPPRDHAERRLRDVCVAKRRSAERSSTLVNTAG
jgi:hypothetical protein